MGLRWRIYDLQFTIYDLRFTIYDFRFQISDLDLQSKPTGFKGKERLQSYSKDLKFMLYT